MKWTANRRQERAACQEHFIDLCNLLGEPTPNTDPTGATYAFEKGATKASGGDGWADVWRRGCFAWEYKGKHKDLDAAHRQLLQYAGALENPPLLVVSDIERIIVRTNWTNIVSARHELLLPELSDPARLTLLKSVLSNPERLRPGKTRQALTEDAAAEFAELALRLRVRGHDAQDVAQFLNRLVFCLFADDVDLLPPGLFERMLGASRANPDRFQDYAGRLFGAMASRRGEVDFTPVAWFNGGLFQDASTLPLESGDIGILQRAANLDWGEIDPSILGTLFERGLDPKKRSQLGAHYTSREMIMRVVDPVVRLPLLAEWEKAKAEIASSLGPAQAALDAALERAAGHAELGEEVREVRGRLSSRAQLALFPELKKQKLVRAVDAVRANLRRAYDQLRAAARVAEERQGTFLSQLRSFRVLDPACGSGNFLYLTLLALKDLEHQVGVEAEALGLQREFSRIGPEVVLGIEQNAYAAELARVSMWIGYIQWGRRHGYPPPSDPVLQPLDTIECRDAVLEEDGRPAAWPTADAVIGNPPFLGTKKQRQRLGAAYTKRLRAAYKGRVPPASDLVCYWFERAREELAAGRAKRAGLVATQNIKSGYSRSALDRIAAESAIFEVWSNELWPLDGADVRVALVCFGERTGAPLRLNGAEVARINSDLSSDEADLTKAAPLPENAGVAFSGTVKGGKLDVPGDLARRWLAEPLNPNSRPNSDVLMPWVNASDVTRRPRGMWIIDFGSNRPEGEAAFYVSPYTHAAAVVRPEKSKSTKYGERWWLLSEWCPGMRRAIGPLRRYIATPSGSSHRLFVWLDAGVQPDHQLVAIARDDDTTFGILHSRFHEAWTRRLSSALGVGDDPRYNPATVFETFPFPEEMTPNLAATRYEGNARASAIADAAQRLVAAREQWLNPPELVRRVEEVVPGFPERLFPLDAAAMATLRGRTLTKLYNTRGTAAGAWLDGLHRTLDAAVAVAYGWPEDISDQEALAELLRLNADRARSASPRAMDAGQGTPVDVWPTVEAEGNARPKPCPPPAPLAQVPGLPRTG